jgi:Mg2+ and Co2+ transporter CorA
MKRLEKNIANELALINTRMLAMEEAFDDKIEDISEAFNDIVEELSFHGECINRLVQNGLKMLNEDTERIKDDLS